MARWTYKAEAAWWNTVLTTVAAFVLFVPCLVVAGALVWLHDLLVEGYIGRRGEGIGWFMRGVQYALAASAAIWLPHLLLRSSNPIISATIVATTLIALGLIALLVSLPEYGWRDWLEWVACTVGIGIGAAMAAKGLHAIQRDWDRR